MSFRLNRHQKHEVQALVLGVIIEAGDDPGVREEYLWDQFNQSVACYGDFTPRQIENLFYERRQQVIPVAQIAVASELSVAS